MSDISGELARVRGAFETPTLTLLHQKFAPVVVAVFRSAFSRDVRTVTTARLHEQVDTYLDQLRAAGEIDLPIGSGRDLCLRWMRGQWLVRGTTDDGTETYSLTSHAQDALALVTSLTRERASLSEHRVATIVSAVRRFNAEANPDRDARVRILDEEINRRTAERSRLLAGGPIDPVTADYMLEGYSELLSLLEALPGDFARVEEAFTALRAQILESFRAEDRHAGDVIDEYLERADNLMTATPEGRAFAGAFTLLRDDVLLLQLKEDLTALLTHPLADDILNDADRRDLRGTVQLIRRGINNVLAQRTSATAALHEYIGTHDVTRDRELAATLRQIDAALTEWMRTAGPRSTVPLELLPPRAEVTHLRERFHSAEDDATVAPLADVSGVRPQDLTLAELLAQGGPSLSALRAALTEALAGADPVASLGELFDSLDPALRRPVEIFGLLQLAKNTVGLDTHPDVETYRTVRSDGTVRDLAVPRVAPRPPGDGEPAATDSNNAREAS